MNRFRFHSELSPNNTVNYESYTKATCAGTASWAPYYTSTSPDTRTGTYRNMDDVTGNAPRRNLGVGGFRFNDMSSSYQSIDAGTGTDWLIKGTANQCTGPDTYQFQYRRTNSSLTLGRQLSGFKHSIDPNGRLILNNPASGQLADYLRSLTSTRVWSNRARGGSQTNLYEALFEVDKTLKLAHEYLTIARNIASSARRNNPAAFAKGVSSAYLMTRYGFMPTVSDTFHTLEALKALVGNVLETTRARESSIDVTSSVKTIGEAGTWNHSTRTLTTTTVSVGAMSLDQYEKTFSDNLGLGYKNFVTVSWELIPLSFVADWFGNVGDFIGSLVPDFGFTQIGSCTSVRTEVKDEFLITSSALVNPSSYTVTVPPSGSCTQTVRTYQRFHGLSCPKILVKPDFRLTNLTRALDAASLLVQRLV